MDIVRLVSRPPPRSTHERCPSRPTALPLASVPAAHRPAVRRPVAAAGRWPTRRRVAEAWRAARGASAVMVLAAVAVAVLRIATGAPGQRRCSASDTVGVADARPGRAVGWVVIRYSAAYLAGDPHERRYVGRAPRHARRRGRWWSVANDLCAPASAWAATSLALHGLLTFFGDRPVAVAVAHKKFLLARCADACMVGAVVAFGLDVRHAAHRPHRGRRPSPRPAAGRRPPRHRAGRPGRAAEVRAAAVPRLADPGDGGADAGVGAAPRRRREPRRVRAAPLRAGGRSRRRRPGCCWWSSAPPPRCVACAGDDHPGQHQGGARLVDVRPDGLHAGAVRPRAVGDGAAAPRSPTRSTRRTRSSVPAASCARRNAGSSRRNRTAPSTALGAVVAAVVALAGTAVGGLAVGAAALRRARLGHAVGDGRHRRPWPSCRCTAGPAAARHRRCSSARWPCRSPTSRCTTVVRARRAARGCGAGRAARGRRAGVRRAVRACRRSCDAPEHGPCARLYPWVYGGLFLDEAFTRAAFARVAAAGADRRPAPLPGPPSVPVFVPARSPWSHRPTPPSLRHDRHPHRSHRHADDPRHRQLVPRSPRPATASRRPGRSTGSSP